VIYFSVDVDEIRRLGKRFRKLDLDNSGALSIDEFMSLPELQQNPLVQRVIDIFDADGNGEVDFKEFIHGVSQFSVKVASLYELLLFWVYFRKAHTSNRSEIWYIMYFGALITNMIIKIGGNVIFKVKMKKNIVF